MIKKIYSYITMFAMAATMSSCLDKYPEDAILEDKAMSSVAEANQTVLGIYSAFKSPSLYSGLLTLLPDIQSDLAYAVEGYSNTYGDIWRWEIFPVNPEVEAVYGSLYRVIGECNFFMEKVQELEKNASDEVFDQLEGYKGEVLFARALAYSELIKLYCKAYDPKTAENELGVVLIDSYSNPGEMKRASLKASYDFVLADLEKAAEYLTADESEKGQGMFYDQVYFTEYVVYSLYARTYLYMQNWEKAIEYATMVIDSGEFTLSPANEQITNGVSYYQYMWQYDHSSEAIWKVGFTSTSYGGALGQVFFNYDFNSMRPDYVPAEWVLGLYAGTDLRYQIFFQQATTGYPHGLTWPLVAKYFGNQEFYEQNILHVTMPKVFRLSELYLIRAEAYCRQENPLYNKAAEDLGTLRRARYQSYGSASVSAESWFKEISEERVRELYMEGFRLQDLKRWAAAGLYDDKEYVFARKAQDFTVAPGNVLKVKKDNPLFVWPIPQHELDLPNSQIQPNDSNN